MPDAGPPPVERSAVARQEPAQEGGLSVPARNYLTIVDTLKANRGAEAKAIQAMFGGDKRLMDQFLAVAFSALQSQPKLLTDCDPMSLVQAIKDAASLGLVPMTEDAAIVPYGRQAKLMVMWRGYVKRIRNSREVTDIDVQLVYMNDVFELQLGTEPKLVHRPILVGEKDPDSGEPLESRGDYRGCYAWAQMPSGKYIIEWMTADDINYVRDTWGNTRKGRDGSEPAWVTSWGEQARKTVIRRLAKRLPAAAVDKLLTLEKANDDAAAELKAISATTTDALDEVRRLALSAVGQIGPGEEPVADTNEEPAKTPEQPPAQDDGADGQGGAGVVAEPKPGEGGPGATAEPERPPTTPLDATADDPGKDPNLRAAMALTEEQEQLARQRRSTRSGR